MGDPINKTKEKIITTIELPELPDPNYISEPPEQDLNIVRQPGPPNPIKAPESLRVENIRDGWIIDLNSFSCSLVELCTLATQLKGYLLDSGKQDSPGYVK